MWLFNFRGNTQAWGELEYLENYSDFTAAMTETSTSSSGLAMAAWTQALAGAWPSGTQASQTSFMVAKSFMSRM